MLNEGAYKAAYEEAARLPCPFEKAILSRCAGCDQVQRLNIAEREAVACKLSVARENCLTLHGLLHQNAAFVLRLTHPDEPLPHAKEIKVQCGGLLGVARLVNPDAVVVDSIHELIGLIQERFGSMARIPYHEVVKSIGTYEGRRRR